MKDGSNDPDENSKTPSHTTTRASYKKATKWLDEGKTQLHCKKITNMPAIVLEFLLITSAIPFQHHTT